MSQFKKTIYPFILISVFIHLSVAIMFFSGEIVKHESYLGRPDQVLKASFKNTQEERVAQPTKKIKPDSSVSQIPTTPAPSPAQESVAPTPKPTGEIGSSEGTNSIKAKYTQKITRLINQKKKYPHKAYSLNQEGKVIVKLVLNKAGEIKELKILQTSPYKSLSDASIELIKKIHKFPPIPNELEMNEMTLNIPIDYKIEM